jgi:nucleotide-binding universal stress UspA family protein
VFKRILAVVGPQPDATVAIRAGVALAKSCDAEIVFYARRQRHRASPAGLTAGEAPGQRDSLDDPREWAERLFLQGQRLAERAGLMSRSAVDTVVEPVDGILKAARAGRCDLIIVAGEGSNAVVRLLSGSVIPGLVTASPVPVLVCTPAFSAKDDGAEAKIDRILFIVESGEPSMSALTQVLDLARRCTAQLLFARIVPADMVPVADMPDFAAGSTEQLCAEMRAQSQRLLASARTAARRAGLAARNMSLPAGSTAKDLARLAEDQACGLIVVAHLGSHALMRLLMGSLIPGLVTSASVPVLICRESNEPVREQAPRRWRHRHETTATALDRTRP